MIFICAAAMSARAAGDRHDGPEFHGPATKTMSDAQIGLLTATPIIILFAVALRRMGVLSTVATASAVSLSVAIAVVLFTTQ
jgi:hypothetical protein